jgi:hypothetical protein
VTSKQSALYWRLWRTVCQKHGWTQADPARRHDAHAKALGYPRSSKDLDNREFTRVMHWFRLMVDPEDLAAAIYFQNPEAADQADHIKRLDYRIGQFPRALVDAIARKNFGAANWFDLEPDSKRKLLLVLDAIRQRQAKPVNVPAAAGATPEAAHA